MAARPTTILDACAGVGMLGLGVHAGCEYFGRSARTICYIERDAYAAATLVARMEDAGLDQAPIWDDLGSFDGRAWRGAVDIFCAGLPCQPYSAAGKRLGADDPRSWAAGAGPVPHALRIIGESRPGIVFLENVPPWVTGGHFEAVGEELSGMGYTVQSPLFVSAASVGASHKRERVFILANAQHVRGWEQSPGREPFPRAVVIGPSGTLADTASHGLEEWHGEPSHGRKEFPPLVRNSVGLFAPGPESAEWASVLHECPQLIPAIKPGLCELVNGVAVVLDAGRADQLRCGGNGVVALQAAVAFVELMRGAGLWM